MAIDLTTPRGNQAIWSKVDADTYFHADAGETHEVILDFEHHRWTWKPASSSAESSSG